MTTPAPAKLDRVALHAFLTGSPTLGTYPATLYDDVETYRRAALAECKARGLTVHLTGTTTPSGHGGTDTLLADCTAQLAEWWPDPTRTDGRAWSLSESVAQLAECCAALDIADRAASRPGWPSLPTLGALGITPERSSWQSAIPNFADDGIHVALPAWGGSPGPGASAPSGSYQRCECLLAGPWEAVTGRVFPRWDFTLAPGFPVDTGTWQTIAQLKNDATGSPPLELMVGRGVVYLQWHDAAGGETGRETLGPATTGVRHSVALDVTITTGHAAVSGWFDGVHAFTADHGPTAYPGQGVYAKVGIYRDAAIGQPAAITHHAAKLGGALTDVTG